MHEHLFQDLQLGSIRQSLIEISETTGSENDWWYLEFCFSEGFIIHENTFIPIILIETMAAAGTLLVATGQEGLRVGMTNYNPLVTDVTVIRIRAFQKKTIRIYSS